jgi:peptide/nickel transport system substrate-binding protein
MDEANYWTRWQLRRSSRRQIVAGAAGVGLTGLLMAACGGQKKTTAGGTSSSSVSTQTTPKLGGTYNTYVAAEPVNMDPQIVTYPSGEAIASGFMSRLFRYKTGTRSGPNPNIIDDIESEPDLAISAESPDAITWTIKLRPDAKFQDIPPVNGHAVEAEDIKATFQRALSIPANPSLGALGMLDASHITTPDKQTVVFRLNYPYAPFNKTLTSPIYSWIFPREALAGSYDPAKVFIGSGPFILKTYTRDVEFILTKNPNWFEKGKPYVDTVHVAVIVDPNAQLAQFTSGHLDDVLVGPNNLDTMKQQNPTAAILPVSSPVDSNIWVSFSDPTSVFQDIRVRQAMSMAIDRDALHKILYNNQYDDTVFLPGNMGKWSLHQKDLDADTAQYYKFDLNKAKALLNQTGILNQPFKWLYGDTTTGPQNEAMRNMMVAAGFKLSTVVVNYQKDYIDSGKGIRQGFGWSKDWIVFAGQQPFTEPDEMLYNYWHSKSTQNEEQLKDPAMDAMIDKERTLVNEDERLKAVLDIQRYIAKKVLILNSGTGKTNLFTQPRVQNFGLATTMDTGVTWSKVWLNQ